MNILFVCTGNTCRSPMAEGYLSSLHIKGVSVLSAGIYAANQKVSENSVEAMYDIGVDISSHISRPITKELLDNAHKIYCMTPSHKATLLMAGVDKDKLFVLKQEGISDPFGQDINAYRKCRQEITDAIDLIFGINKPAAQILSKEDCAQIFNIEKECFDRPWSENSIKQAIENKNIFFGVKEQNKLIGYCSIFDTAQEGYINNVAVIKEKRRCGIARILLSALTHYALNACLSFITLEVRQSNTPAIKLYNSFGFKKEGIRKNYYSDPKEDAIILTRRF